ncbi:hypothetical protein U2F26_34500 [Micromonospora sp. 4G57]|uniref:HEAT repeat domain-containing protein n=1 Tax=Micromonospora sicca TaxID=2202420 RepID=A0ABU5JP93_9ACTN|nr:MULTISPECIES: hypothetical protein [unclassified Micromonospora]MDZ5447759.1 hypothetical protein [Micromonospora sp. 4G57]MDZ5494470.1 hypothetical protein [Micromonospora sp. 4G53]
MAAIAYSYLLSGAHPPGLTVPITGVGLQQRVQGHLLDDIVLAAEPSPTPLSTEYQVKLTLTVTAKDPQFVSVVTQALHVLRDRADDIARGDLDLGVAARGDQEPLEQLAELARFARGHTAEETFAQVFAPRVVGRPVRDRLTHVRRAVETAIADGAPDLGGVEVSSHAFLSALHVWPVSDGDDGADYLAALDRLAPAAESFAVNPVDLFTHLAALAQGWGVVAGVVDANSLRRQLRRRGLGLRKIADDSQPFGPEMVDADAVVRNPIAALELEGSLDRAEQLLAAEDPSAADLFADLANRLEEARFWPHAAVMRRREASARQRAGQADEAAISRVGLAWNHLDVVQPWEAGFALNDGRRPGAADDISGLASRVSHAAEAAVWVAKGSSLDDLVKAFDALEGDDLYRERAAAFLCEHAIADARPTIVLDRRDLLEAIARDAAGRGDGPTKRCGARIQMCIADATGEWAPLLPEIHRRYPRPIVAWAHARYGRHLALSGDGAGAQTQYLLAVERACIAKMFDEAADWLYALRTVRFWYTNVGRDDEHPLAQALRPNAKPSQLPGSPHSAEHALRAMLAEDKPGEALQRGRQWRWQTVVRAQLTEELDAVRALGKLLQRHDEISAAIECFVRAGAQKEAATAARRLPDVPAHLDTGMLGPVQVCRAAAYSAVATAADLIADDNGRAWADAALAELAVGQGWRTLVPSARLSALDALAALCGCLTDNQVDELLRLVEPLIDRPEDRYRETDDAVAKILISVSAKRPDAVPLLIRALLADQHMAGTILAGAIDALKAHKAAVGEMLARAAPTNEYACLALILAGLDPAPGLELARNRVKQAMIPRAHEPGQVIYYADANRIAILASVLDSKTRNMVASTMLDRALDRREATPSRRDSLRGLNNIISDTDSETQAALLPPLLEMARGDHNGGPIDDIDRAGGPFDMVRINMGPPTLSDLALECAAHIAADEHHCATIEQTGYALLRTADESGQWRIGRALTLLPGDRPEPYLGLLASHPSPALRAVAAVRWARDSAVLPAGMAMQLASDDDYRVRQVLAHRLRENYTPGTADESAKEVINILASDARRSVRTHMATLVSNPTYAARA